MIRLVVLIALAVVAVLIALALQRRRPDPPSAPSYRGPSQLDRADFEGPGMAHLAVVFASTACSSCPAVWALLEPRATERLAVQRVDVETRPELHERYRIDGVPTTVVADDEGVVTHTFFGPINDDTLTEVLATLDR